MSVSRIALLITLSLSCLVGSYLIVPSVSFKDLGQDRLQHVQILSVQSDTLALPSISDATFQRTSLKRDVIVGDTLGMLLKDPYSSFRDSLSAFAKTGIDRPKLSNTPSEIRDELLAMVPAPSRAVPKRLIKSRYVLRGTAREYLLSEIMGAEDASVELTGRLSHLVDAGKRNSSKYESLEAQLQEKQRFISASKQRLTEKEEYTLASNKQSVSEAPQLTPEQRKRILALSATLPIDTQQVYAPISGRYYRPDDGVGYIISNPHTMKSDVLQAVDAAKAAYILEADGSPVLWGTAVRNNNSLERSSSAKTSMQVVVE